MTVFWSLAAVMVMVALLFVLPPLLRQRKVLAVSLDDLNTKVIKEQLAELTLNRSCSMILIQPTMHRQMPPNTAAAGSPCC
jgi:cytochrome c-type biogenesis protein CcmI